ncbi:MAG TPA: hypothetical protein VHG30_01660 [Microvirga sp.]|nr:hypothetical protein [Microvirga sp.]
MAALEEERKTAADQGVARDERATGKPVFLARPTQQPVDYATLRKDVMARFAKTLAYLAK